MTKKKIVKAIYDVYPQLINDDVALCIYLVKRHGADEIGWQAAMRKMGNFEHWTRAARLVRVDIKKEKEKRERLFNKKVEEERARLEAEYRQINQPEAISWL